MRQVHNVCDEYGDVATASLLEVSIDETERRTWLLLRRPGTSAPTTDFRRLWSDRRGLRVLASRPGGNHLMGARDISAPPVTHPLTDNRRWLSCTTVLPPKDAGDASSRSGADYAIVRTVFVISTEQRIARAHPAWDGSVGAKCAVATPGRLEGGKPRFTGGCSSPTDRLNRSRHVPPADEFASIERQRPSVWFVDGDAPACVAAPLVICWMLQTRQFGCFVTTMTLQPRKLSLVVTAAIVFETIAHTCGNAHGAQSRQGSGYVFMMFQR